MGRKYHYPGRTHRSSGKSGLIGAVISAVLGRGRRGRHWPAAASHRPTYRKSSVKGRILSYIVKRLLKKFL